MVRTEVEGIGLDFFLCKLQFVINVELNRVDPVSVVPDMEVLLILCQQKLAQLFFFSHDCLVKLVNILDKPLPETPQCVRFWVISDQLCDQFYLIDKELSLLFEIIRIYFDGPFQKLPPEIKDGGDVGTELHEEGSEFHVLGDVIV
jgi:hypothetical protein